VAELASDRIRIGGIVAHGEHHAGKLLRHHQIFGPETDLSVLLRDLAVHGVFVDRILVTLSVDQLASGLQAQLRGIQADSMIRVEHLPEQLGLYSRVSHEAASESSLGGGLNGGPIMNDQVSVFDIEALGKSAERSYWKAKRLIDVVLAGFFLILFAPLLLVVSGLVALAVGLPTIFWQDRPGMAGRPFRLYKFRTMGPAFDSRGAPVPEARRLNVIGHFLRATRLDELPQLWNILIGDMSFVGPRPLLNVDQPVELAARLLVRPGLTGWAQVSAGRQVSASDKAALDVWYVRNASLMLDLEIFARTVPIVLFRERRCTAAIERAWADLKNSGLCSPVLTEGLASKQDATVYASVPREKIRASAG
jgi:lipopolysaccharide/colanic/teichoic acid biosynthesis glycosyltransferase